MTVEQRTLEGRLDEALNRIQRLEEYMGATEQPLPRWRYLVARSHHWRRQLEVKGRNLTVGQLIGTLRANRLSPEEASADLDLPLEAIQEALTYYEENQALIQLEAAEERRRLAGGGCALEPRNLSR